MPGIAILALIALIKSPELHSTFSFLIMSVATVVRGMSSSSNVVMFVIRLKTFITSFPFIAANLG